MNHSEGMRHRNLPVLAGLLVALALVAANVRVTSAGPAAAPRAATYDISWYTVAGGGGQDLTGRTFSLKGTAGQSDASAASGGSFAIDGGFWIQVDSLVSSIDYKLYLPLIRR